MMSLFARIFYLKKESEGGLKWHQRALSLIHELLEKLCMKKRKVRSTKLEALFLIASKRAFTINGFYLVNPPRSQPRVTTIMIPRNL
jgi:hypothetical protein